jgi:D-glycero-D-manno-heptose 1,7-bisphosphate phosphatase
MKRRALFLDRDGVINKKPPEHDYVKCWEEFEFVPGIENLIKTFNKKGYLVIVFTNQRGVARGMMTEKDLNDIHEKMMKELREKGAIINTVYSCIHDYSDNCECRKPKPGLLTMAADDFEIDLARSLVIGDDETDILAGKAVGCKTLLVRSSVTWPLDLSTLI